jgi:hypothetical protein
MAAAGSSGMRSLAAVLQPEFVHIASIGLGRSKSQLRQPTGPDAQMAVTIATFRRIALSLPEAAEGSHMGHPDFRVRNKVFASLGTPDENWGTVKLTPEQQQVLVEAEPRMFKPAAGAWGRRGWTHVSLAAVDSTTLESAIAMAWCNTAPKALLAKREST